MPDVQLHPDEVIDRRLVKRCPECRHTYCVEQLSGVNGYEHWRAECSRCDWSQDVYRHQRTRETITLEVDQLPPPPVDISPQQPATTDSNSTEARPMSRCRLCENQTIARGLCSSHYSRWNSCGSPDLQTWLDAGAPTKSDWRDHPKNPERARESKQPQKPVRMATINRPPANDPPAPSSPAATAVTSAEPAKQPDPPAPSIRIEQQRPAATRKETGPSLSESPTDGKTTCNDNEIPLDKAIRRVGLALRDAKSLIRLINMWSSSPDQAQLAIKEYERAVKNNSEEAA